MALYFPFQKKFRFTFYFFFVLFWADNVYIALVECLRKIITHFLLQYLYSESTCLLHTQNNIDFDFEFDFFTLYHLMTRFHINLYQSCSICFTLCVFFCFISLSLSITSSILCSIWNKKLTISNFWWICKKSSNESNKQLTN